MKVLAYRLGVLTAVGGIALGLAALSPSDSFAQAPSPACVLSVNPSSIYIGQSVTLRWSSAYATEGIITDVGSVSPSGSINLIPSSAAVTRYEGTFVGPGGTVRCSTSVTVSAQGPGMDPGFVNQTQTMPSAFPQAPATLQTSAPLTQTSQSSRGGLVSCGNSSNPILATMCNLCDIGILIQNIINFLIVLSIPLSAGLFAWAGILYFTAQGGSESIDKAHRIFKSVFIGFIMVVSAYFVVQTLLSALIDQNFFFTSGSWSNLQCADPSHNPANADYNPQNPDARPRTSSISQLFSAVTSMGGTIGSGGVVSGRVGQVGTGDCSPANLSVFGVHSTVMSCIARAESGCRTTASGDRGFSIGLFQINMTANNVVCNGQTLRCPTAFSGAYTCRNGVCNIPTITNQQLADQCRTALQNPTCNIQTAQSVLATPRGLANWTKYADNTCH